MCSGGRAGGPVSVYVWDLWLSSRVATTHSLRPCCHSFSPALLTPLGSAGSWWTAATRPGCAQSWRRWRQRERRMPSTARACGWRITPSCSWACRYACTVSVHAPPLCLPLSSWAGGMSSLRASLVLPCGERCFPPDIMLLAAPRLSAPPCACCATPPSHPAGAAAGPHPCVGCVCGAGGSSQGPSHGWLHRAAGGFRAGQ